MADNACCSDDPLVLLSLILLEFIALATGVPANLYPTSSDGRTDLYRKILLVLPYI